MSAYPATCLLGHRLNAFRLGHVSPAIYIQIGGAWTGAAQGVIIDSLAIQDRLNDEANTLIATIRGTKPVEGGAIRVALGSHNAAPLFAGTLLRVTRVWGADNPAHVLYHVEATDPTWPLQGVLFSARYENQSASTIAADLLTRAPAGYSGVIQAGLPVLDTLSFTNTTLMDAFVQLAKRIGGYTLCDYLARVHLFTTDDGTAAPRALYADHPSLAGVSYVRDLTQIITRAIVEGGGVNALAPVPPGSPVLPVETVAWYAPGGGYVRSGAQRIQYAGVTAGGAGSFAGTGVTPTTAPAVTATIGTSPVELGAHSYAYTWVTGVGETLPSPLGTVTLGAPALPAAVDVAAILNVTSGLVIGVTYTYTYAWSYVASDTDVSQVSAVQPDTRSAVCQAWQKPSSLATPGAAPGLAYDRATTGAVDLGSHWYAYTFVTAIGESLPSPAPAITLADIPPPTTAPVWASVKAGSAWAPDPSHGFVIGATVRVGVVVGYAVATPGTPVSAIGPASAAFTLAQAAGFPAGQIRVEQFTCPRTNDAQATSGTLYASAWNGGAGAWDPWYPTGVPYNNAAPGTVLVDFDRPPGTAYPLPPAAPWSRVLVSGLAAGSGGVTGRKIYRTAAGGGVLRWLATIANTTATTYSDGAPDSSLGAEPPTAALDTVPGGITWAPYPGAWDPAAKRLLAFRALAGQWRLVKALPVGQAWTIGTYRDTVSDAAIAADPATYPANPAPGAGNATLGRAVVSGVAPGPAGGVGVTARRIYRTAAGGAQLKLWATLADNTSTTVPGYDATPDASLGATAPTSDTAGVIQTAKFVSAGSTELPVTSTAPFSDTGGYVQVGTQVIGYRGRSSTALTGVPATGDNAIGTSIPWGTPVTTAPALIGIPATGAGAIRWALLRGDPVNVVVIVDDLPAQAALAALLGGGDGVRESLLADGRIGLTEAAARGRALLAANKAVRETVAYRSRDPNTRSGAQIVVDLPAPTDIHGTYRIQDVGITRFHARGLVPPTYETRASSQQFTFEDWIRQLARTQAPPATGE
jgi:hypothetical protein